MMRSRAGRKRVITEGVHRSQSVRTNCRIPHGKAVRNDGHARLFLTMGAARHSEQLYREESGIKRRELLPNRFLKAIREALKTCAVVALIIAPVSAFGQAPAQVPQNPPKIIDNPVPPKIKLPGPPP